MYKAVKKSLIIGSILSSIPVVYAQNPYSDMGSAFGEVANVLLAVLYGIAEFLGPLLSMFEGSQGEVLGRTLLGVIIAIILYMGLKDVDFIKKQEKGASFAKAIAIIIALISAIGIPPEVITGLVGGYQIWLFVFAAIIILIFGKGESRIGFALKGISYFIFGLGTYTIGSTLSDGILRMAIMLMSGIFILGFVYYLFYKAVVGKGIGETVKGFGEGASQIGAGLGGIGEGVGGLAKGLASGAEGIKGLIDTISPWLKKENVLIKQLEGLEGRNLNLIKDIKNLLEELKNILTSKGITKDTKEKINNVLGNAVNKIKFCEQILQSYRAGLGDIKKWKRETLKLSKIISGAKLNLGLIPAEIKIFNNKISQLRTELSTIIADYNTKSDDLIKDLEAANTNLFNLETDIRNNVNKFKINIDSNKVGDAINNLIEMINFYTNEETIISNMGDIQEKLENLNNSLNGEIENKVIEIVETAKVAAASAQKSKKKP